MSETYKHVCIKPGCSNSYEDNDPDAYYCESCQEEKKKIAEQIDKQIGSRPKKQGMSMIERYDAMSAKNGGRFPNIKDLGIKL